MSNVIWLLKQSLASLSQRLEGTSELIEQINIALRRINQVQSVWLTDDLIKFSEYTEFSIDEDRFCTYREVLMVGYDQYKGVWQLLAWGPIFLFQTGNWCASSQIFPNEAELEPLGDSMADEQIRKVLILLLPKLIEKMERQADAFECLIEELEESTKKSDSEHS